jgi:ADP-ribosyl-[dinitrogen reductase] hydrolase
MARTSESDPIHFSEVLCGHGVLGLTFCPGKSGPSVFGDDWDRDLEIDLDAARAWGASTVLTLVEAHELNMLQVEGLGAAVEARGMTWLHAPIKDVSIPDATFERRWTLIGHLVRSELNQGNRVVVHCRGGRGRAGLIAARLLVEFGAEPNEAIKTVRRARPGTIETREQEDYVRQCGPIVHDHQMADRVLGCLFGGAVGDGFGYAIEFDRLAEIRRKHGPDGLLEPVLKHGKLIVSDDTQMTLFTASALADVTSDEDPVPAIRTAYLDWHRTQTTSAPAAGEKGLLRYTELWKRRAPGMTCMSALSAGGHGTPSQRINDSKGCGGVMRVAPIGLMLGWDHEQAFDVAARAAALTHGHPSGYLSAGVMASIVRQMLDGTGPSEAWDRAGEILAGYAEGGETMNAMRQAFELARTSQDHGRDVALGRLGEGWVGEEALAMALYSVLVSSDFIEAMRVSANHDGDSDSTASIAGQLYGAWFGLAGIPWIWMRDLDVFDAVCEVAGPLIAATVSAPAFETKH